MLPTRNSRFRETQSCFANFRQKQSTTSEYFSYYVSTSIHSPASLHLLLPTFSFQNFLFLSSFFFLKSPRSLTRRIRRCWKIERSISMEEQRIPALSKFLLPLPRKTHDTSPAFDVECPSLLTSNRTIFQPQCYHQSRFSRGSVFSNRVNPPLFLFLTEARVSICFPVFHSSRERAIRNVRA